MIYALLAAVLALAWAAWKIGRLRQSLMDMQAAHAEESKQTAAQLIAKGAEVVALREHLREAQRLLMDDRVRGRQSGDRNNRIDWMQERDELIKRIGGAK